MKNGKNSFNKRPYEAPKMEIIEIQTPVVLCSSAENGGTEKVGINTFGWI